MPYRTCDHLKEDGVYCSSPALRDQRYCYFHLNARARRVQAARAKLHNEPFRLQMPILDNAHAILSGIQQALDALAGNRISARQAAVYLYGLQMASISLKSQPEWKGSRPEIEADEPLRALEVHSLQEQYDLPFDTDLDAPPDVAAAEIDASIALPLDARHGQSHRPYLARVPARSAPQIYPAQGAPAPALSLSKGSPVLWANLGEMPDAPAPVRKPPAETCPDASSPADAA
jgi:hypothetical protein